MAGFFSAWGKPPACQRDKPEACRKILILTKYDAVIIGGGHNGLVTAAYLARAGGKVLVLEARELVGGCAVTEEIWPGYRVSTASYLTSLMQDESCAIWSSSASATASTRRTRRSSRPFPDGRHLFMWQDRAKDARRNREILATRRRRFPAYEDHLDGTRMVVESLLLTTPPDFPPRASAILSTI